MKKFNLFSSLLIHRQLVEFRQSVANVLAKQILYLTGSMNAHSLDQTFAGTGHSRMAPAVTRPCANIVRNALTNSHKAQTKKHTSLGLTANLSQLKLNHFDRRIHAHMFVRVSFPLRCFSPLNTPSVALINSTLRLTI